MAQKRALICEDDKAIRMLVKTVVRREGFEVDLAENGRQGLERLKDGCYDLLVLDLMMPEIDGYAMVEQLKESKSAALKRIIVMTAASEAMRGDFPAPICTFLPKPFDVDELAKAVRNCARACDA